MNKKLLYNLVAAFLIILLSISINSILVLCLGEDGHVEIETFKISSEFPHNSKIHNGITNGKPIGGFKTNENNCGDCIDITIFSDSILTDNKTKDLKSISKKLSDFSLFTLPHETHGNDFIKMKYFNTDISTSRFSNLFKTIIIQV